MILRWYSDVNKSVMVHLAIYGKIPFEHLKSLPESSLNEFGAWTSDHNNQLLTSTWCHQADNRDVLLWLTHHAETHWACQFLYQTEVLLSMLYSINFVLANISSPVHSCFPKQRILGQAWRSCLWLLWTRPQASWSWHWTSQTELSPCLVCPKRCKSAPKGIAFKKEMFICCLLKADSSPAWGQASICSGSTSGGYICMINRTV